MFRLFFALFMIPQTVAAQEFISDAFGIVAASESGDRADWAGLRQSTQEGDIVQAAGRTDAVILFVGPKSIVAGGEPGHAVALALDVHGNLISGARAGVQLGYGRLVVATTVNGIADVVFTPPPIAGTFLAGIEIDGVQSARADYRVTANLATVSARFASTDPSVVSETFGWIETAPLTDAYGNTVDDGVGVGFVLSDGSGASTVVPSVVRDGAARSVFLARDLSGSMRGRLALAGAGVEGLTVTVGDMDITDTGPIAIWAEPAIDSIRIRVGPLATSRGYLVPDGTAASVDVRAADGTRRAAQAWVLDGYVTVGLLLSPDAGPFDVSLTVASTRLDRRVDLSPPPENLTIRGAE